jgi:transglutaminase-like putative cysteine protease
MKKLAALIILILSTFALFVSVAHAEESGAKSFITDTTITYDVSKDGKTTVTHSITLENVFTDLYATQYTLKLFGIDPESLIATQNGQKLQMETTKQGNEADITITFPDAVVGRGNKRQFNISYKDDKVLQKTGQIWEVFIPKLNDAETFRDYLVRLNIPPQLGELSYISPQPASKQNQNGKTTYYFDKQTLLEGPIKAGFGNFQVFSFNLTYHLENPLAKKAYVDISLPPDTNYQRVNIDTIDPKPFNVTSDEDGNWLAKYILDPRARVDVKTLGSVQIFAEPKNKLTMDEDMKKRYLASSDVWDTQDPNIVELAQKLKTPKAIYDYVVSILSYDYDRVKPNVERLGALAALQNPHSAICMEFTDLFIALARAAGIPSREINGFAYTENPDIQPLSLVADVLHSWPEYWDDTRGTWVPIDPTWGNTTHGLDYFSKLDLRHFAFVMHGMDPYKPYPPGSYKLGPNPQKDVFVSFSEYQPHVQSEPLLTALTNGNSLTANIEVLFSIKNTGSVAIEPTTATVYFDEKQESTYYVASIPPFGHQDIHKSVPYSFFAQKLPSQIRLSVYGETVSVNTQKQLVQLENIAIVGLLFVGILWIVYIWQKRKNLKVFKFSDFKYGNFKSK